MLTLADDIETTRIAAYFGENLEFQGEIFRSFIILFFRSINQPANSARRDYAERLRGYYGRSRDLYTFLRLEQHPAFIYVDLFCTFAKFGTITDWFSQILEESVKYARIKISDERWADSLHVGESWPYPPKLSCHHARLSAAHNSHQLDQGTALGSLARSRPDAPCPVPRAAEARADHYAG
jgi:hypothetical protein